MFYIYYSNSLEVQKDILVYHLQQVKSDVFQSDTILVQSPSMAQWLNWKIAENTGIASNINYPLPASFIWQLYVDNLPQIEKQSLFNKDILSWRIMKLLPQFIEIPEFKPLKYYLSKHPELNQQKSYQLAKLVADLFDQYLVYRPQWINFFETNQENKILEVLMTNSKNIIYKQQLKQDLAWQGILWRACVKDITNNQHSPNHRSSLHQQFMQLDNSRLCNIPPRIFIFGISALPQSYLEILQKLSHNCDIHLFFTNGCQLYWGDLIDPSYWQKVQLRQKLSYLENLNLAPLKLNAVKKFTFSNYNEKLAWGNTLLASWGKMGRDFLAMLTEMANNGICPVQEISAYVESQEPSLLNQIHRKILNCEPSEANSLTLAPHDNSISIHHCYTPMREVEVLHDYLLHLFQQDPELTPKDIVVMVADIDQYAPYIQAVFSKNNKIPFSINDKKITENDVLVNCFFRLLNFRENHWVTEEILGLLEIPAIGEQFEINGTDLSILRNWIKESGIRYGFDSQAHLFNSYNSWSDGLKRMLLGLSMREEDGIWNDCIALNNTDGLDSQLVGKLCAFVEALHDWQKLILIPHSIEQWQIHLQHLLTTFFDRSQQSAIWFLLNQSIENLVYQIKLNQFISELEVEVISQALQSELDERNLNYHFNLGKVNFCTLLPMRSIPFKTVCLLGMNENDYPRIKEKNSFDLMAYHHQKGDRSRRDDDRYLFLEALLSAQEHFYISFISNNVNDDSAKESSVLVSQFKDYLQENLGDLTKINYYYPINVFSANNFKGDLPSFDQAWFKFAKNYQLNNENLFKGELSDNLPILQNNNIEIDELIKFISNPVRYFFEKRLGVYWRSDNELIPDTEVFTFNSLELYNINKDLLDFTKEKGIQPSEFSTKFPEIWKAFQHRGLTPHANFSEISAEKIYTESLRFQESIQQITPAEPMREMKLNLPLNTLQGEFKLCGKIKFWNNLLVEFRHTKLKTKDLVGLWIKHLALCSQNEAVESVFLGELDNKKYFSPIPPAQALQQLQTYANDFKCPQLFILPNFKVDDLSKLNEDKVRDSLINSNKTDYHKEFNDDLPYWQRLNITTDNVDQILPAVITKFHEWFDLLIQQLNSDKNSSKNKAKK